MKTILKTTLVAVICISFSSFAYGRHESSGISPYIGGIVGSTEYTASSGNTSETKSAGIGFGVDIGLKLTNNFGKEIMLLTSLSIMRKLKTHYQILNLNLSKFFRVTKTP